jgi:UDP-N-acetylglucosamine--N-acetylmuramyl-(pentapeptide) pyrophosphoryl-undecaprenol N-acetylglucosamine transferase
MNIVTFIKLATVIFIFCALILNLLKNKALLSFNKFRMSVGKEFTQLDNNVVKTMCCVAGKSGGHIIPCLTIAQDQNTKILFFSANTQLDKTILSTNKNIARHVMLPLSSNTGFLKRIWHVIYSFVLSFFYLCKDRPSKIITTGGIVAIPPCIAGFILRIPITLYSLDAVPGKAIQFLTPLATSVVTPFASSQKYFPTHKCNIEPYPIKYKNSHVTTERELALQKLGLSTEKKTILILGGSQGSLFLNECIKKWTIDESFLLDDIQIIHQTGSGDATDWNSMYKEKNVTAHVFSYYPDLALMYTAANLIICRAGAGTLFEIKFFNKPCIIIPLKTKTTTHQVDNAQAMVTEYPGLFCTIAQEDIEKNNSLLFSTIKQYLK